jgi:hypothetical protein
MLGAPMLAVRHRDEERLVLGTSRRDELGGLFLFVAGLMGLGLIGVLVLDSEGFTDFGLLLNVGQYVVLALVAGALILYFQEKVLLDKAAGEVSHYRGLRASRRWAFDQVDRVEVRCTNQKREYGQCRLLLRDGVAISLGYGSLNACRQMAEVVSGFTGLPLGPEVYGPPAPSKGS